MSGLAKIENINSIIKATEQSALLDSNAAGICGVEVKSMNQAVKNNPGKSPAKKNQ